jgi:hypothetical protein
MDTYPLPGPRVAHCAIGAHRLALKLAQSEDLPAFARDEATKIALLVSEIPSDVAAMQALVERYEEDMRGLRDAGLELAHEVNCLRRQITPETAGSIPLTTEPRARVG